MWRLALALSFLLLLGTSARAQPLAPGVQQQAWRVAPVKDAGVFVFCSMSATFDSGDAPVTLTIALDRANDWAVSVHGERLSLPLGPVGGQLWFDDQEPTGLNGVVRVSNTVSFLLRGPALLEANANAKKLTLAFANKSLRFDLGSFPGAVQSLKGCWASYMRLANAGSPPLPTSPPSLPLQSPTSGPQQPAPAKIGPSGGKSSYFMTLGAAKVELRAEANAKSPVQWIFVRKGLPVEVLEAAEPWKKIRDSDGAEGWVLQDALSTQRNVVVVGGVRNLWRDTTAQAAIVALLEPGVLMQAVRCDSQWCEVQFKSYRGWLKRGQLWGLEPGETIP